ncbi:MAG: LysR family transcriptional regulator [Bdellovibrionota bacterium]
MEIFELRYFLGVAQTENIHRASETLRVSPASLSKAVSRIEDELSVKLFSREGRNIRLTEHGRYLRGKAVEILRIEESARAEISGMNAKLRVVIAGPEILLSHFGVKLVEKIRKRHPQSTVEYQACSDEQTSEKVAQGDAHLGLISGEAPRGITGKKIEEVTFKTAIGGSHPLASRARTGKKLDIAEVLNYGFVSPSLPYLGNVGVHQSLDGWRDDQFPRRVEHQTSSLKLLEKIVTSGKAIAYLPDYLVKDLGLTVLSITGCPYVCSQTIQLIARRPKEVGWIHSLF